MVCWQYGFRSTYLRITKFNNVVWIISSVICFYSMMLSPDKPLCWKDAVVPMEFTNEASYILVRDRLAKDLDVDLNARNVKLSLQCKEKIKYDQT